MPSSLLAPVPFSTGVKWILEQQQPPTTEDDDAIPALYALVRLTLDPVRQDVLEALAPHLEAWKRRCLADTGATMPGAGGEGRWSQVGLIAALRRIVRLERLGVYAQEEAKRQLAGAYVSGTLMMVDGIGLWVQPMGMAPSFHSSRPPAQTNQPNKPTGAVRKRASTGGRGKQVGTAAGMAEACVWDVQDLLGWNPMAGPPPEGLPDPTAPHNRRLSRLEVRHMLMSVGGRE